MRDSKKPSSAINLLYTILGEVERGIEPADESADVIVQSVYELIDNFLKEESFSNSPTQAGVPDKWYSTHIQKFGEGEDAEMGFSARDVSNLLDHLTTTTKSENREPDFYLVSFGHPTDILTHEVFTSDTSATFRKKALEQKGFLIVKLRHLYLRESL